MNQKISSGPVADIKFGTLTTLIGTVGTRMLLHKALSAHRESIFLQLFL